MKGTGKNHVANDKARFTFPETLGTQFGEKTVIIPRIIEYDENQGLVVVSRLCQVVGSETHRESVSAVL
jgi:hypothetical protein